MVIRDSVHGDIELTALESALLDTAAVQRLRGIRQLGAAHLVYPGCNHTRFEHALGTLHLARRIMDRLARRGYPVDEWREAVAAAALLHDVSFVPYGHFLEDVLGVLPPHDTPGRILEALSGEVAAVLEGGLLGRVAGVLTGGAPPWARAVIAGVIDADMLDYLRRDAYHAGLALAYDDRVFRYLTLVNGALGVEIQQGGMPRPDAVSELVNLLRLRYYLTERVYCHHAKLAAESMVGKSLDIALANGYPASRLTGLTDADLPGELARAGAAPIMGGFSRRRLFKRAYVLSGRSVPAEERAVLAGRFRLTAARLEAETQLGKMAAICCLPSSRMKEAGMLLSTRCRLPREAPLAMEGLEAGYSGLWRLYVFAPEDEAERVGAAAAAFFGRPSEYGRGVA